MATVLSIFTIIVAQDASAHWKPASIFPTLLHCSGPKCFAPWETDLYISYFAPYSGSKSLSHSNFITSQQIYHSHLGGYL